VVVGKDLGEERAECGQGREDGLVDVDDFLLDGLEDGIDIEDLAEGQALPQCERLEDGDQLSDCPIRVPSDVERL
jgi:hypothetical protein